MIDRYIYILLYIVIDIKPPKKKQLLLIPIPFCLHEVLAKSVEVAGETSRLSSMQCCPLFRLLQAPQAVSELLMTTWLHPRAKILDPKMGKSPWI